MKFERARWITTKRFAEQQPLDLRGKEILCQDNPSHPDEFRNVHFLFRLAFHWDGSGKAILRYSADDIAKVYINGTFLQMGPAPSYHFRYDVNQLDVTALLESGINILAAHVYYQGELNRVWTSGDFRTGFIGEIQSGKDILAATGETTRVRESSAYRNGGLTGYRTQYLEDFDACQWEKAWAERGFDDHSWDCATIKENNDHVFSFGEAKPLSFYEVPPISAVRAERDTVLYDFGCEYAGTLCFEASGERGSVIQIFYAEELNRDGRARYDMRCNCLYRQSFSLSGNGWESPDYFDYMGFRYAEVAVPEGVRIRHVRLLARNYPFDGAVTSFSSGHAMLGKIWTICKNGVRTGTQEGHLDCPTREKGLYLGDMTISAQSHFYLTGDPTVYKRALRGFGISTYYLPTIQTTCLNHYFNSVVDYSFQFPLNLLIYYRHTGDKDFLWEMLPHAEMMMESYRAYEKRGLLQDIIRELHLVDWPRNPFDFSDGYDYDLSTGKTTGTHNVANAFYIGAHLHMDEIRRILGESPRGRAEELIPAYWEAFYDPQKKRFRDTRESSHGALHSNVLPLFFNIAPLDSISSILDMIREKRFHCGVYMAYFLLKALARHGQYDLIFDLITAEEPFSWGNMVREDASTCFEVWGKEYKWNTSLCHPWASAPIPVFIEDLLGVEPVSPGWRDGFTVSPRLPDRLEFLDMTFRVLGYRIRVEWEKGKEIRAVRLSD